MYKIIIADDHQIVTEGITRILEEMTTDGEPLGEVVASVHTLADCLVACRDQQPDKSHNSKAAGAKWFSASAAHSRKYPYS